MIRRYHPDDRNILISILRLNTPKYFDPAEEKDFEDYLDNHLEHYYVMESNGKVIGCGGVNFSTDRTIGILSWDMFHPSEQGKGLGAELTRFRIEEIKNESTINRIAVRTSQLATGFYARFGFQLKSMTKDYWGAGLDLYEMEIIL
jgi:ribosomal-protein-alanine N-acetyltransferase